MTTLTETAARGLLRQRNLPHIWCPGCSNGIALRAIAKAILLAGLDRDRTVIVSGIGCSSRASGYLDFDTVHTTHGRPLAFATGMKLANPDLNVIVVAGDGDTAAIGGNHFIHAARRNVGIAMVCFNNNVYGMTGGQYSPTTHPGDLATTAPYGHLEREFDLCDLARAAGATYVARGTAYHFQPLVNYLASALRHKGFAFVEVLSSCPVYYGRQNKIGGAPEMLKWIADRTVTVRQAEKLPPEALSGRVVVGELWRAEAPEYVASYLEMARRAEERAGRDGAAGGGAAGDGRARDGGATPGPAGPPAAERRPAHLEVRLAGSGGQGQVLAAIILADAAGLYDGYHVVQSQDYGPESRGGASKAEVILDARGEVDFPKVGRPDVLVAMSQAAYDKYAASVREGGLILADSTWVRTLSPKPRAVIRALPLTAIARDRVGRALVANVVALGALAALTGAVSFRALERAVLARAPRGTEEINRRALAAGYEAGKGEAAT